MSRKRRKKRNKQGQEPRGSGHDKPPSMEAFGGQAPEDAPEKLKRAVEFHQAGRFRKAEALYQEVLADDPKNGQALQFFGALCYALGEWDRAAKHISEALKIIGPHPGLLSNLGLAWHQLQRYDRAVVCFARALQLAPDFLDARYNLGRSFIASGQPEEAFASLQAVLQKNPNDHQVLCEMGKALVAAKRYREALPYWQKAILINPDYAPAYNGLGNTLRTLGLYVEAERSLQFAVQLDPGLVSKVENSLGILYQGWGDYDEAEKHYRKALSLDQTSCQGFYDLARLKNLPPEDPAVRQAERLLQGDTLTRTSRIFLCYGLYRTYATAKDTEKAFPYLARGSRLQREIMPFAIEEPTGHMRAIQKQFTRDLFEAKSEFGHATDRPRFIVGSPRSGTSLTEQILASHPDIFGAGELLKLSDLLLSLPGRLKCPQKYPGCISELGQEDAGAMAQEYLDYVTANAGDESCVTDKLPTNFFHLGAIALLFPNTRIIHCRRHPMAACFSCFETRFTNGQAYTYDLEELGTWYRHYWDLMDHWRQVLPLPMLEIRYEGLVEDTEGVTRRMLQFFGLEWDEACLRFYETNRQVKTASDVQVRKPIYKGSLDKWKHYEKQLEPLRAMLADIIEEYEATAGNEAAA